MGYETFVRQKMGATAITGREEIQELWNGYGSCFRLFLSGSKVASVVVKHISLEARGQHPRGWAGGRSHERKLKSYQVETAWYDEYGAQCDDSCRIPHCYGVQKKGTETVIILEDLVVAGFPKVVRSVSWNKAQACVDWLACFHSTFMGQKPKNLWKNGTYWHLKTRPDEWAVLDDKALKAAAPLIDEKLSKSGFQTFVHGDAKLANFCFSHDFLKVAAVDFQYVGGGCGMKDLAYFVGSCLDETQCQQRESEILDYYFSRLILHLDAKENGISGKAVEDDWRPLYWFAWADFQRFVRGWSPGHWKINNYSNHIIAKVLESCHDAVKR